MMKKTKNVSCGCNAVTCPNRNTRPVTFKNALRTIPSLSLSLIIAFFPKCPMCWIIYMSMLGNFGIASIPYMWWLLPVFMLFLGIHLWILYKKIPQKGYGPFTVSCIGFALILLSKIIIMNIQCLGIMGMLLIFLGSLWNSLSNNFWIERLRV